MTRSGSKRGYDDSDYYEDDYDYYDKKKKRRSRRRAGDVISTIVIIAIIVILLLLVADAGFREAVKNIFTPDVEGYREYPEWAVYDVQRVITVTPQSSSFPMEYEIDIPKPEDIPNSTDPWLQDVRSIATNPSANEIKKGYPGNYTWFLWNETDASSQRSLSITYSIRTESAVWDLEPSDSGTVADVPKWLADKYGNRTKEEWKILPAHSQIKSLSDQLTGGKITIYDKLKAIFDYLNENYDYVTARTGEPKYCYETYNLRSGDCDDQSVLFISLARAAGIPTWLEFGALYNQKQNSWGGHAWVRAYIPYYYGGGHVFIIDIVNDHFLFRDAFKFSEWESDGNGSHLEDYYHSTGRNFNYDEYYNTLSMEVSSDTIRISESGRPVEETVPGFEGIVGVTAILIAAVILRRKKRS